MDAMASIDPFDELLQLEDDFYKEGYEAGVADSAYAGLVEEIAPTPAGQDLSVIQTMPKLPNSARLRKNINSLLALTDPASLPRDNSDDSVSDLDGRIIKARAKAKMIATMIGESIVTNSQSTVIGIEDSTGLNARH
ncbi:hypothetical protein DV738_g1967, partial [Chaetothyriales sp. CBS 135597]